MTASPCRLQLCRSLLIGTHKAHPAWQSMRQSSCCLSFPASLASLTEIVWPTLWHSGWPALPPRQQQPTRGPARAMARAAIQGPALATARAAIPLSAAQVKSMRWIGQGRVPYEVQGRTHRGALSRQILQLVLAQPAPPGFSAADEGGNGTNVGIIVGPIVGILVPVLAIAGFVLYRRRRRAFRGFSRGGHSPANSGKSRELRAGPDATQSLLSVPLLLLLLALGWRVTPACCSRRVPYHRCVPCR